MSRLNIFLLVTLVFLLILARANGAPNSQEAQVQDSKLVVSPTQTPTPTPIPDIPPPTRLIIPKLSIDVQIAPVGLDAIGKMEVPEPDKVGWLETGAKPGEKGNAVIAGHFDTVWGTPAVFYRLAHLNPGDQVLVIDEAGTTHTFYISYKGFYDWNKVPTDVVFGDNGITRLNLITCAGVWDPVAHNYSERLILFTQSDE